MIEASSSKIVLTKLLRFSICKNFPSLAIATDPLVSLTTIDTESVISDIPKAARCLLPYWLEIFLLVKGK